MKSVVVIGAGNVARALCPALAASRGVRLAQICARDADAARTLAERCECPSAPLSGEIASADLYILAVSDGAVGELSALPALRGGVVAHTAGSVPMGEISPLVADRAVIYPLQTFSAGHGIDFGRVPILIEGSTARALECVREVASSLSSHVRKMDSDQRARVHLAAVFAGNFANHMYAIGEELARGAGGDFDMLRPLVTETALKAAEASSPRDAQTGPAVRGDASTLRKHERMLREHPAYREIYERISNSIWEISRKI